MEAQETETPSNIRFDVRLSPGVGTDHPLSVADGAPPNAALDRAFSAFLAPIFQGTIGNIEMRAFPSRARIFSRSRARLRAFVESHLSEEIFFGVGTRKNSDGTKEGIAEVSTLWADLDFTNFKGGEGEALEAVARFPLAPTFAVRSGHGLHTYFLLDKPEPPSRKIENVLRGIAKALNADPACAELARCMRLPGTFNRKNGAEALVTFE